MKRLFLALVGLALLGACAPTTTTEGPKAPTPPAKTTLTEEEAKAAVAELLRPFAEVDLDALLGESGYCYGVYVGPESLVYKRIMTNKERAREKLLPTWGKIDPDSVFISDISDLRDGRLDKVVIYAKATVWGKETRLRFELAPNYSGKRPRFCVYERSIPSNLNDRFGPMDYHAFGFFFKQHLERVADELAQGK